VQSHDLPKPRQNLVVIGIVGEAVWFLPETCIMLNYKDRVVDMSPCWKTLRVYHRAWTTLRVAHTPTTSTTTKIFPLLQEGKEAGPTEVRRERDVFSIRKPVEVPLSACRGRVAVKVTKPILQASNAHEMAFSPILPPTSVPPIPHAAYPAHPGPAVIRP
jgi:hypothetical protein